MGRLVLAAVAALLISAPAQAATLLPDVGPVVKLPDGLYEVQLRTGPPITTHGADGPPSSDGAIEVAPRAPDCAESSSVRVLFGRPALSFESLDSAAPRIREALWRLNGALDHAALESGDRHADLRVRCDATGDIRIDSFVNATTASFADVVDAARLAGATDPGADYVVFYADDSPSACGVGSFTDDDRPGAENVNNQGGGYAVVYSDCWDESTALHEIAHTQGAVQPSGPHATGQGHCRDEIDVMCYADGAEGAAGMLSVCDHQTFDCGYDDYFDTAPAPGSYLDEHWNLGSGANRFLDLSAPDPGEADLIAAGCTLMPVWMSPELCDATGDEAGATPEPPVRIVRARVRGERVRVVLRCPVARSTACRGSVRAATSSRGFRLVPGELHALRLRLRRTSVGPLRVVAEDADGVVAARVARRRARG
jgi:hypothetical protein